MLWEAVNGTKGYIVEKLGSYITTKRQMESKEFLANPSDGKNIGKREIIERHERPQKMGGYTKTIRRYENRLPANEEEERRLQVETEKIKLIKNSKDSYLDERGTIAVRFSDGSKGYVETDVRRALLALGEENFKKYFTIYREQEEQTSQEDKISDRANSKISFGTLKEAIKKFLGKGER